jgi:hypothetical protein
MGIIHGIPQDFFVRGLIPIERLRQLNRVAYSLNAKAYVLLSRRETVMNHGVSTVYLQVLHIFTLSFDSDLPWVSSLNVQLTKFHRMRLGLALPKEQKGIVCVQLNSEFFCSLSSHLVVDLGSCLSVLERKSLEAGVKARLEEFRGP